MRASGKPRKAETEPPDTVLKLAVKTAPGTTPSTRSV
jgi:hypothetical protein